jgi:dUTP pyrophosphatase
MLGENNHQYGLKGECNGSYKNDWKINTNGYLSVRDLLHPFRNADDFIMFHRIIMEEYLRETEPDSEYLIAVECHSDLYLSPSVVIHHKNMNRLDNRIENLEILSKGDHFALHQECRRYQKDSLGRYVDVTPRAKRSCIAVPSKGDIEDAGNDIRAAEEVEILPKESKVISTQLNIAIPKGHVGFIWSRSGLAAKNNIECGAGCIDSGYRGEIKVLLRNLGDKTFKVEVGDRIAQLVILPILLAGFDTVDELDETVRGIGGFGSTGLK